MGNVNFIRVFFSFVVGIVLFLSGVYLQAEWNAFEGIKNSIAHWSSESSSGKGVPLSEKPSNVVTPEKISRQTKGLGYFQGRVKSSATERVPLHNESRTTSGLNFYVSSHYPEAYLMTNEGKVLHRWRGSWSRVFPDTAPEDAGLGRPVEGLKTYTIWRNGVLLSDGSIVAVYDGNGLVKLDRKSEVIWAKSIPAHHDIWVSRDESKLYVLTYHIKESSLRHTSQVLDESVVVIDSKTGRILEQYSLLEALLNSNYTSILSRVKGHELAGPIEIFHANDIDIVTNPPDRVSPPFREGYAMISMRYLNAVGLVDLSKPEFTWMLSGIFFEQHDPDLLPNGNLLVFDNGKQYSRVIELDPLTKEITWRYEGSEENGFFSRCCGLNQRMDNGNTVITETRDGRAFEVTPDNEIVWEFLSPHTLGENNEYVAPLAALKRYDFNHVRSWLGDVSR